MHMYFHVVGRALVYIETWLSWVRVPSKTAPGFFQALSVLDGSLLSCTNISFSSVLIVKERETDGGGKNERDVFNP